MIYDLSNPEVEQSASINSNNDLYNYVIKHAATKRRVKTNNSDESALKCITCDDEPCNVQSIVRSCQCTNAPCEAHECQCKPHPVCARCLVTQLWTASSTALRQRGVYRAKCPTCRAEYCWHDIVLYNSMDDYADRYFETTLKCLTSNMPDLFNVDLSHHDLSQDKLVRLAEALWHNTHLQGLDLFANNTHQGQFHGWKKLGQALARLPKLVEIDIAHCQLGDTGLQQLLGDEQSAGPDHVPSLSHVTVNLITIDLSNNAFTEQSAPLIAKFVKRQQHLEELALHTNAWTDHVIPIFADALADKPHLRKVWLQKSGLSSEGVTQLRSLLPEHVTLMV